MSTEGCQPVSCDDHDLLEEASMHRKLVELEFELDGVTQKESGTIADVYTADGAEFVKLVAPNGLWRFAWTPSSRCGPGELRYHQRMPKPLFYIGTAFCLFLALTAAAAVGEQLQGGPAGFVALQGRTASMTGAAGWAIVVALLAGLAVAAILVRMAALLAARHLFGAFLALFAVSAAIVSLAWVLLLQARIVALLHRRMVVSGDLAEMHFAGMMMLGYFVALSFLALRPYFRIQASRFLSALVLLPLPLYLLILIQEIFVAPSAAPLPATTPAWLVFFSIVSLLFFAIAVHCIRHRHMFIETTNLRELLEPRVDPARAASGPIGGVAFDS